MGKKSARTSADLGRARRTEASWNLVVTWSRAGFGLLFSIFLVLGCHRAVPPNFVLITIDCLRADRLAAYGYHESITPNLDSIAEKGAVFERAFAPIATTHPSHATMLTGLYPRYHGVRWNGQALPSEIETVAETLQKAGYSTGAFVSYRAMLFRARLDQGFQAVSDRQRQKDGELFRDGRETTELATGWLKTLDRGPFFLWVHYFEPHYPLQLRPYSAQRFSDRGYTGLIDRGVTPDLVAKYGTQILRLIRQSKEDVEAHRILYDGEVFQADSYVGELMDALRQRDFLNNTVVVATGDHGEGLGEHGRWGHGPVLWDSVLHVPLLLRDFRRSESLRISQTVGLVDLTPTFLELADVAIPAGLQGRSLVPALHGRTLESRPYFAEVKGWAEGVPTPDWYSENAVAVFLRNYKQTIYREKVQLFDLEKDPEELRPLSDSELEEISGLLRGLAGEFLARKNRSSEISLSEEDRRELASLGYL